MVDDSTGMLEEVGSIDKVLLTHSLPQPLQLTYALI